MEKGKLTPNQIEYLSWAIMAEVLKIIAEEVVLADLHLGDGQYDCLSLVTYDQDVVLMLNRNGTSAAGPGDRSISGIWERAALKGIGETALFILNELGISINKNAAARNKELITTCRRIAYWVYSRSKGLGKAQCCWVDSTYGAGPAGGLLEQVTIPQVWTDFDGPYRGSDWSAHLYALTVPDQTLGDKVVGLVHMERGEAVLADGSKWEEWTAPIPVMRRIVPTNQHIGGEPKKIISLPFIAPHPDGVAAFRTLKNFNGYKVLGEDLAPIANAIAKQWYEDKSLPNDVDQLKGALFYESRRAKFIDGFPGEVDVPYLQALVAAIEAGEK
jgi:hypothetical protein